jgi:hypothetical protein
VKFFGSLSILGDETYSESAEAQTPCCVISIGADEFRRLLDELRIEVHSDVKRQLSMLKKSGKTSVLVAYDNHVIGLLGIAMGAAGTDVAIETADIALMADDLMKLPEAIRLSKATLGNIRQNLVVALVTVAGLLLGVMLGAVHMAGGMLIHEVSVLVVILNGVRLLRE